MATPAWIGATSGQPPLANQVSQFLGAHATTYLYTGVEFDHQATAGSGAVDSNGLYIAQRFTPSSNYTTGRVVLTLAVTGTPGPWSVTIQSNGAGVPSGTVLAGPTAVVPAFLPASAAAVSIPLPGAALVSGTPYWIVAAPAGDASDFVAWSESNQTSGVMTSTNGTSWTAQAYGLLFQVWDNSAVPPLAHTYGDGGARWTSWTESAAGEPTSVREYTVAQGSGQYVASSRALAYTNGALTSVT